MKPRYLIAGTISDKSPRYADWMAVYGCDTVPLLSPVSHTGNAPGQEGKQFYKVNVRLLDPATIDRIVEFIADRFHVAAVAVRDDLFADDQGLPILADDVTVTLDARAGL